MYLCDKDIECVYLYDFTITKPGAVMHLCVTDIECVYQYDFTITKLRAVMCLCVKDIVSMRMILSVLNQERSCIYV